MKLKLFGQNAIRKVANWEKYTPNSMVDIPDAVSLSFELDPLSVRRFVEVNLRWPSAEFESRLDATIGHFMPNIDQSRRRELMTCEERVRLFSDGER